MGRGQRFGFDLGFRASPCQAGVNVFVLLGGVTCPLARDKRFRVVGVSHPTPNVVNSQNVVRHRGVNRPIIDNI